MQALVTFQHGIVQMFSWSFIGYAILIVATVLAVRKSGEYDLTKVNGYYPIFDLSTFKGQFVLFLVIGLILGLAYTGENPFVYFQF